MKIHSVILVISIVWMMSAGQVLLKISAGYLGESGFNPVVLLNRYFLTAVILYGVAVLLWLVVLRDVQLSRVYPFVVLSFVFTPLLAWGFLGETLSWSYFLGLTLICGGLLLIV